MRTRIAASILLALLTASASEGAQNGEDRCHVYIVDLEAAREAVQRLEDDEAAAAKLAAKAQTLMPEFRPTIGEEALTTRHFDFPGTKGYVITASVYYTDESMAARGSAESVAIGVAVGTRRYENALGPDVTNGAIAETTYTDETGKLRARQFVTVSGRMYLVGLECDFSTPATSKP